jgi:hypothetical protein
VMEAGKLLTKRYLFESVVGRKRLEFVNLGARGMRPCFRPLHVTETDERWEIQRRFRFQRYVTAIECSSRVGHEVFNTGIIVMQIEQNRIY